MEFSVIGIITIFIAATIMLSIGTTILGSTSLDCDFNGDGTPPKGASTAADYVKTSGANTVGKTAITGTTYNEWEKTCLETQTSSESSYGLLVLIILIIAAVGVLGAIRLLGA